MTENSGGRLVATDGSILRLTGTRLHSEARGGTARTTLVQRFKNAHDDALTVTYSLPLPADGAVSGFSFRSADHRLKGVVESRRSAIPAYWKTLLSGREFELEPDDVFTQEIGSIPPGAEVIAKTTIDQPLRWLSEGAWEWRFPCVLASETPPDVRGELTLWIADTLTPAGAPSSPSHAIRFESTGDALMVAVADIALDRDIAIRWPVARPEIGATLDVGRPAADHACADAAYGLLTIVPPLTDAAAPRFARNLVILLDTSGSMEGDSLAVARAFVTPLIESLDDRDSLEVIAFSSALERWRGEAVRATSGAKHDALRWLAKRKALGNTKMRTVIEVLRGLRPDVERQIILVTDGLICHENATVAGVLKDLPASSHLHTIGVGSLRDRWLTTAVARAGRGVEVLAPGGGEDRAEAMRRILEATCVPLLVDVVLDGSALLEHAPKRLPDLLGASPALIAVKLRPKGGELIVHGRTPRGSWRARFDVAPVAHASGNAAVCASFGREVVRDLEMPGAESESDAVSRKIEEMGLSFQIATTWTAWVAVADNSWFVNGIRFSSIEQNPGRGLSSFVSQVPGERMRLLLEGEGIDVESFEAASRQPKRSDPRDKRDQDGKGKVLGPGCWWGEVPLIGHITVFVRWILVVGVTVQAVTYWDPSEIEVYWSDGTQTAASVITGNTTNPGRIGPGLTLRLALRVPEPADPSTRPTGIKVSGGPRRLSIQIEEW